MPRRSAPLVGGAVALALLTSCASQGACQAEPSHPDCADLRFGSHYYQEWRETDPEPVLQELGDAVYPACNDAENCGPDLGGFAATDVWLLEGVDPDQAVIGRRQSTDTFVIFLRRGVDADEVPGLRRAAG